MAKIYEDNSFAIGNTPLVKLKSVTKNAKATVLAKIEGRNPAYSVKCRIGANMIWDAEKSGKLTKDKTIVEPTSGNTGIALAFTASARGYKLILTMPESMSIERRRVMAVLGAEIVLTEASKGMPGAIAKAKEIAESNPSQYFMPGQFDNPANPEIHFKTTGPEIWDDCDGEIDVLVAGVGTGGTITGVSRYIKQEKGKNITSVAVEPSHSPFITQTMNGEEVKSGPHKIQGIGANMIWDAEKSGKLTKDKTIVEPTSGNTGIALAFTASARGYKLILTMPESMSIERRRVMAVLGAEIVLTEASKGCLLYTSDAADED